MVARTSAGAGAGRGTASAYVDRVRAMTETEAAAREAGLVLISRYPPFMDPEVHRGDGCVACPSFGTTCDGLEREWWTELEWEDMWDRMSSD